MKRGAGRGGNCILVDDAHLLSRNLIPHPLWPWLPGGNSVLIQVPIPMALGICNGNVVGFDLGRPVNIKETILSNVLIFMIGLSWIITGNVIPLAPGGAGGWSQLC